MCWFLLVGSQEKNLRCSCLQLKNSFLLLDAIGTRGRGWGCSRRRLFVVVMMCVFSFSFFFQIFRTLKRIFRRFSLQVKEFSTIIMFKHHFLFLSIVEKLRRLVEWKFSRNFTLFPPFEQLQFTLNTLTSTHIESCSIFYHFRFLLDASKILQANNFFFVFVFNRRNNRKSQTIPISL